MTRVRYPEGSLFRKFTILSNLKPNPKADPKPNPNRNLYLSTAVCTRVIPKVSGLDILDNNIFHNLYISETYILYEL